MATPALPTRLQLLSLYKTLLYHAVRFPTRNRDQMILEIKADWRKGRAETDPAVILKNVNRAVEGVKIMGQYVDLDKSKTAWSIELGKHGHGRT